MSWSTCDADLPAAGMPPMSAIGQRVRRFLQKPGTADLSRFQRLLPAIAAREDTLRALPAEKLAGLLTDAKDQAERMAVLREAAFRAIGERPYDVQVLGTLAMLSGHVAEMATGEGKTLSRRTGRHRLRRPGPQGARDVGQRLSGQAGRRLDAPGL